MYTWKEVEVQIRERARSGQACCRNTYLRSPAMMGCTGLLACQLSEGMRRARMGCKGLTACRIKAGDSPRKSDVAPSLRTIDRMLRSKSRGARTPRCMSLRASWARVFATSIGSVMLSATAADNRLAQRRSVWSAPWMNPVVSPNLSLPKKRPPSCPPQNP